MYIYWLLLLVVGMFLQCFDIVGLVIWPVKVVPEMTYNVLSGTLSLYTTAGMLFAVRDANGTVKWPMSCQPGQATAQFMFGAYEYVKLATYSVIPFVIILTLNVAIIVRLRRNTPLLRYARHGSSLSLIHISEPTRPY